MLYKLFEGGRMKVLNMTRDDDREVVVISKEKYDYFLGLENEIAVKVHISCDNDAIKEAIENAIEEVQKKVDKKLIMKEIIYDDDLEWNKVQKEALEYTLRNRECLW